MSPWQLVLVLGLGGSCGWVARAFEETAMRERAVERLRPFGPPLSHCRLRPEPYDQEVDRGLG